MVKLDKMHIHAKLCQLVKIVKVAEMVQLNKMQKTS